MSFTNVKVPCIADNFGKDWVDKDRSLRSRLREREPVHPRIQPCLRPTPNAGHQGASQRQHRQYQRGLTQITLRFQNIGGTNRGSRASSLP
jgi:hypothetical protein